MFRQQHRGAKVSGFLRFSFDSIDLSSVSLGTFSAHSPHRSITMSTSTNQNERIKNFSRFTQISLSPLRSRTLSTSAGQQCGNQLLSDHSDLSWFSPDFMALIDQQPMHRLLSVQIYFKAQIYFGSHRSFLAHTDLQLCQLAIKHNATLLMDVAFFLRSGDSSSSLVRSSSSQQQQCIRQQ